MAKKKYLNDLGARFVISKFMGILNLKAAKDLSDVEDADFVNKAEQSGAGGTPNVAATSTDGVTYTATVPGWTELVIGKSIVITPDKTSTNVSVKLNVNGLGEKHIRLLTGYNTATTTTGAVASWMAAGKPVEVRYDGTYWIADLQRASANALSGVVKIENGGTGASTAEQARKNLGGMASTAVTIPAGRMRGDVDGDGKITDADRQLIADHASETALITDATALLCADIDGDGEVGLGDRQAAARISAGTLGAGYGGDILGNWTVNPNYSSDEMQFYTDIAIPGMETGDSATIFVRGKGNFRGECANGALRLYATLCPIAGLQAVVQYGSGDGSVVVFCEETETEIGIVPVEKGGTGASSAEEARAALGITPENIGVIPIETGGTGATTAAEARVALGITPENVGAAPAYTYGTEDLVAGVSPLETGKIYFVYE